MGESDLLTSVKAVSICETHPVSPVAGHPSTRQFACAMIGSRMELGFASTTCFKCLLRKVAGATEVHGLLHVPVDHFDDS